MRILVWQWGRFGAGPRVAAELADGLRLAGAESVILSLSDGAEILNGAEAARPRCELTVRTYATPLGFAGQVVARPFRGRGFRRLVEAWAPQVGLCAMPALLDDKMVDALEALGVPVAAIIHDADLHPGDGVPLQMRMQRRLMRRATALVTLSGHVERRVREQVGPGRTMLRARLPPLRFGPPPLPPGAHGGPLRLLFFGRLLPYKGLDLLAASLARLDRTGLVVRVVGQGPEGAALDALRALDGVTVENGWVPEAAIASLIAWSDALVLPYREASQSGVAAAALSARRWVVATDVGGLRDQFAGEAQARLCAPDDAAIAASLASLLASDWRGGPVDDGRDDEALEQVGGELLAALRQAFGTPEPVGLAFGEA